MKRLLTIALLLSLLVVLFLFKTGGTKAASPQSCGGWRVIPSPNQGQGIHSNYLYSVSADSSNDAWTLGYYEQYKSFLRPLVEHWNGTQWSIVPGAALPGTSNSITGIQAISSNDVVALASYTNGNNVYYSVLEHWNGTQWNEVSGSQIPTTSDQSVTSMAAISDNNIWVAGVTSPPKGQWTTLIEHWNGTSWSVVPSPNAGKGLNTLQSIVALAANNIWAAGNYTTKSGSETLTEHWDGTQWKVVHSLNVGGENGLSQIVQVTGTTDLWAVGSSSPHINTISQTLTEFYC